MEVLEASIDDAQTILSLQKEAYKSEAALNGNFDIPPLTQSLEDVQAVFKDYKVLKIVSEGKLLASAQIRLKDNTAYIGRLAVWPEHQGKGLGSKLLDVLENSSKEASRIELFTGEQSVKNIKMYKKRGYKEFKSALLGKTKIVFLERYI